MSVAIGPFMVAATLLALAGVLKAWQPRETAVALRGVGIPIGPALVRAAGAGEALVGIAAVLRGDRLGAVLVGGSYVAFAGFVGVALARSAPIASCGCFGTLDTPPSTGHVLFGFGAATTAVCVGLRPGFGIADVLRDQPLAGAPYLLLLAVGVGSALLVLSALPRTSGPPSAR